MTKPKLLIVDDDEDIRVQMKWALADDYEVPWPATGRRRWPRSRPSGPS